MKKLKATYLIIFFSFIIIYSCHKDEENKAPTCTITNPANGEEIQQGQIVTISVAAEDSDGDVTEVCFYLDGSEVSSSNSYPYNYDWNTSDEEIGNHTIKVTAKDDEGESTTDEIDVEIIVVAPIVSFTADTTEIKTGESIQFTDESNNNPTSWNWDFGDGGTSSQQNPAYIYTTAGIYTVNLTATNIAGSNTETKTDYILVFGESGTLTDSRDGKVYKTVQIGNQIWMAENLNYVTSDGSWVYDNKSSNASTYGRLYDWKTATNVCPSGWHLPSDDEWKQLEMAIGMSQSNADHDLWWRGTDEGFKLKSTSGWYYNGNGLDVYGFTALPGGLRSDHGDFKSKGSYAMFWSSTSAWVRSLCYSYKTVFRAKYISSMGFSVRCVKD